MSNKRETTNTSRDTTTTKVDHDSPAAGATGTPTKEATRTSTTSSTTGTYPDILLQESFIIDITGSTSVVSAVYNLDLVLAIMAWDKTLANIQGALPKLLLLETAASLATKVATFPNNMDRIFADQVAPTFTHDTYLAYCQRTYPI